MSTSVLTIENTFNLAESYNVDVDQQQKLSFFEKILIWYSDSLHSYYENVKNTTYSPFSISSNEAALYLKQAKKYHSQFDSLAKKYAKIKDDDILINDIHDYLIKIANEFEIAEEYLTSLSDPIKHAKIKESIGALHDSNFLED